jgi:quinol monooxygenase YgiN
VPLDGHASQRIAKGEDDVAIKVIVELKAMPGRRAELHALLDAILTEQGANQQGFLGSTRYEVPDDPDMLIEIAEWVSAETRAAHMREAAATGAYEPLMEILAAPIRATVIRQLP